MPTTVVNPSPNNGAGSGSGLGFLMAAVVLVLFVFVFFYYGLPVLKQQTGASPQINVPKSLDVNLQQSK
jgi:hypothetical protein